MASITARIRAGYAWCQPKTSHIEMNVDLAEAFAEIIDEIWSKPWLSNATTGEMLDEIKARVDTEYRTTQAPMKVPLPQMTTVLGKEGPLSEYISPTDKAQSA